MFGECRDGCGCEKGFAILRIRVIASLSFFIAGVGVLSSDPGPTSTPDYTLGYSEDYLRFLERSTRRNAIEYLAPFLKPGLRVLDVGCGPGLVSALLAEAVVPGEVHGIDMEPSQIEMARHYTAELGWDNVSFHVADVVDLPFEDGFFDVVCCNDVLAYVPDTGGALSEIKRVLKSGGVVGCRELIVDSCFAHPELGFMSRGLEVFADLLAADDGHPRIGKDLKMRLDEEGFEDILVSGSFNVYDTADEIEMFYEMVKGWFLSIDISEAAKKYGAATDRLFANIGMAYDEWKGKPGALAGIAFGQVVATRP